MCIIEDRKQAKGCEKVRKEEVTIMSHVMPCWPIC
jgi:hypothetical protein